MADPCELALPADLAEWREQVRVFLTREMEPERVAAHRDDSDLTGLDETFERAHHRAAGRAGFLAIALPVTDGGGGRPRSWKHVYDFEAAFHGAPSIDTAVTLCAQPLVLFGSAEQKRRRLAPMIRGDLLACVAYSEAGAGNDLAAITTEAGRTDDGWVLRGEKVLVTGAHKADVALVLARTDPAAPPRESMSMFLIDLSSAGIEIERTPTINRWTLETVRFRGVSVPDDALVGRVGDGWTQVMAALAEERGSLAHLGWAARRIIDLPSGMDPRDRGLVFVEYARARLFAQRLVDRAERADRAPHPDLPATEGAEASISKVVGTELLQQIARAAMRVDGPGRTRWAGRAASEPHHGFDAIEWLHPTISVGANETHRDMIAAAVLQPGSDPEHPLVRSATAAAHDRAQRVAGSPLERSATLVDGRDTTILITPTATDSRTTVITPTGTDREGPGDVTAITAITALIDGEVTDVEYATTAHLLVVATEETIALIATDAVGVTVTPTPSIGEHSLATVRFDRAEATIITTAESAPSDPDVDGGEHPLTPLPVRGVADRLDDARLDLCAQMVEHAAATFAIVRRRVLDHQVFGRPLAELQVARHRLVDMHIALESMRLAVEWVDRAADRATAITVAKVICNEGGLDVALGAQQLHGGVGYLADGPLDGHAGAAWARSHQLGATDPLLIELAAADPTPV